MAKFIFLIVTIIIMSCSKNPHLSSPNTTEPKLGSRGVGELYSVNQEIAALLITNLKGEPLAGAQVLIGPKMANPFAHNFFTANDLGQVNLPKEWTGKASVTVNHPGYLRATYIDLLPQKATLKLRPIDQIDRIELTGKTVGFGPLERNNVADFGLVLPALEKTDLFAFSLDKLISPETDSVEVAGIEAKIPSNLTFPRQKETYVLPITLEKENYRIYFNEPGSKNLYALHGKFPFKQVVDKIRNKVPFISLINYFDFSSGSIRDVLLPGPTTVHLPVNELEFTTMGTVLPPQLPANQVVLTVSLFEKFERLYPTDMHKIEGTEPFELRGLFGSHRLLLSVLKKASDFNGKSAQPGFDTASIELVNHDEPHSPHFLDLMDKPVPTTQGWTQKTPTREATFIPLATYSVHSQKIKNGKNTQFVRDWEVYAPQWIESIQLPEWPDQKEYFSADPTPSQKWEITYLATDQGVPPNETLPVGPDISHKTTHISFSSIEF